MAWQAMTTIDTSMLNILKTSLGESGFSACCDEFVVELNRLVEAYQKLRDEGDDSSACETAHALKGAAMNIGLMRLGQLAAQFELALSRGQAPEDEDGLVSTLDEALLALRQAA